MDFRLKLALSLAPLAAGCAHVNSRGIAYDGGEDNDTLFVWKSNYSAGIGVNDGMCAQAATTADSTALTAAAEVGAEALKAINPAAITSSENGKLADVALGTSKSVMLTNATTAQTAFANIAFFYLCQISLNQKLTGEDIKVMWEQANQTIEKVGNGSAVTAALSAPSVTLPRRDESTSDTTTTTTTTVGNN